MDEKKNDHSDGFHDAVAAVEIRFKFMNVV